jgi:hypothetical protein
MHYELDDHDRHRLYLALLSEKQRVQQQIDMGPESGWEGHLEAWEANFDSMKDVERLLALFAPQPKSR